MATRNRSNHTLRTALLVATGALTISLVSPARSATAHGVSVSVGVRIPVRPVYRPAPVYDPYPSWAPSPVYYPPATYVPPPVYVPRPVYGRRAVYAAPCRRPVSVWVWIPGFWDFGAWIDGYWTTELRYQ